MVRPSPAFRTNRSMATKMPERNRKKLLPWKEQMEESLRWRVKREYSRRMVGVEMEG